MSGEAEDGLRLVLSPVQLAAVLQRGSIGDAESRSRRIWNRVDGGLNVVFGGLELLGSAALLLTPEPTMLTKVAGVGLGVHGADTTSTGMVELWTGDHQVTMTAQAAAAAARNMGYDPKTSDAIGATVDILVPVVLTGVLGATRASAIRSGRLVLEADEDAARATSRWTPAERSRYVNLEEEELAGGHSVSKHIGKTEADCGRAWQPNRASPPPGRSSRWRRRRSSSAAA